MRIVYIGTGDIGLPTLRWLLAHHEVAAVVAQPDKPVGRKQELTPPLTKVLAQEHGVPVLQPKRIRNPEALEEIAALRPEVIVVMAYGQILPKALLDLPPLGCLNLHASILPRQRGAAPIQAAMEAGDAETGVTVMWMDEGLDTGDILLIHRMPIDANETGGELHDRLAEAAPAALAEALGRIAAGDAPRIPQEHALATYASKLSRESGVIDWSASAAAIDRRVRAMNPWPAASTRLPAAPNAPAKTLKVFAVTPNSISLTPATPGTVLETSPHGILVAAGEGTVLLREVQMEGKRRMSAGEFLRGNPLTPGSLLGEAVVHP
jgi:methionyl-tRNA formyltransferase